MRHSQTDVGVDGDRVEPYDAMPADAGFGGGGPNVSDGASVVGPADLSKIQNGTHWAVLCPSDVGRWLWMGPPSLFQSVDSARDAAQGIPGSIVYPVELGITGPGMQPVV